MKRTIGRNFGVLATVILGAFACAAEPRTAETDAVAAAAARTGAETGAAARIEADLRYLADDALEGREAGTPGYQRAADYVAARMAAIGLTPAGEEGGFFQTVPLLSARHVLEAAKFSVTGPDGETVALTQLEDVRVVSSIAADAFDISAPAVFVGFGVEAPDFGHDDYAGLDVDGKIAVMFSGAPDFLGSEPRAHFSSSTKKLSTAAAHGAIGVVSLYNAAAQKRHPWERVIDHPRETSMTWIGPDGAPHVAAPTIKGRATLRPDRSELLFAGAPRSFAEVLAEADSEGGAPKGFDLAVTIAMAGALERASTASPNVVGVIPGADPELKDEYVVLSAHLDHLGVNEDLVKEGEDGINNGAMDNAMGVSVMLETATAILAGERPRRSVLILAVTGEEKGLLGSDYFARFPTVPQDRLVADVNLDMPTVLYPFTDIIAFGAEHSSLGPTTERALAHSGVALSPDPMSDLGIFTRSDHYRFVEQGVPSLFLWPGFANGGQEAFEDFYENHYHKPSDDVSLPIRYEDAARFADINLMIAREVANADDRPRWNEGDFFGDLFAGE